MAVFNSLGSRYGSLIVGKAYNFKQLEKEPLLNTMAFTLLINVCLKKLIPQKCNLIIGDFVKTGLSITLAFLFVGGTALAQQRVDGGIARSSGGGKVTKCEKPVIPPQIGKDHQFFHLLNSHWRKTRNFYDFISSTRTYIQVDLAKAAKEISHYIVLNAPCNDYEQVRQHILLASLLWAFKFKLSNSDNFAGFQSAFNSLDIHLTSKYWEELDDDQVKMMSGWLALTFEACYSAAQNNQSRSPSRETKDVINKCQNSLIPFLQSIKLVVPHAHSTRYTELSNLASKVVELLYGIGYPVKGKPNPKSDSFSRNSSYSSLLSSEFDLINHYLELVAEYKFGKKPSWSLSDIVEYPRYRIGHLEVKQCFEAYEDVQTNPNTYAQKYKVILDHPKCEFLKW